MQNRCYSVDTYAKIKTNLPSRVPQRLGHITSKQVRVDRMKIFRRPNIHREERDVQCDFGSSDFKGQRSGTGCVFTVERDCVRERRTNCFPTGTCYKMDANSTVRPRPPLTLKRKNPCVNSLNKADNWDFPLGERSLYLLQHYYLREAMPATRYAAQYRLNCYTLVTLQVLHGSIWMLHATF